MPARPALLALAALLACKGADRAAATPAPAAAVPPAPAAAVPPAQPAAVPPAQPAAVPSAPAAAVPPAQPAAVPSAAPAAPAGPATPAAPPQAATSPPTPPAPTGCQRASFAPTVDLAEASGAIHVAADGALPAHLLVVADSGNRGAFAVLDPTTGVELGRGALPLDPGASDDLEGIARVGPLYVALTSSGYARHYRRLGLTRFELAGHAYPIGDPRARDGLVCRSPKQSNCGRNWEDLCLFDRPPADGGCAGFAASKRDGQLVCLAWQGSRLRADPGRAVAVAGPEALAACAAVDADTVLAGSNLFGAARVVRVTGLAAGTAAARTASLGPLGSGFPEAIAAAPGGVVYRFSDLANRPSLMDRFVCR